MLLHIRSVGPADFGSYKCVAKNSLGETDGTIKLYSKLFDGYFDKQKMKFYLRRTGPFYPKEI